MQSQEQTAQKTTLIIGGQREFTCFRMNAFDANILLLRLKKVFLPILGSLIGSDKGKAALDMDVKEAASAIAEHIDESVVQGIVLPMLDKSRTYCTDLKSFVNSETAINKCFTTENLHEFYELIFLVGRYQFGPFLEKMIAQFGDRIAEKLNEQTSPESSANS